MMTSSTTYIPFGNLFKVSLQTCVLLYHNLNNDFYLFCKSVFDKNFLRIRTRICIREVLCSSRVQNIRVV